MFPGMFWVKYLFRVMHIGSLVVVCQSVITAKMTGHTPTGHNLLYMLSGIFVIISGKTYVIKVWSISIFSAPRIWEIKESYGLLIITSKH